jgi:enoyl-CoA hydratase/carnithine racemase
MATESDAMTLLIEVVGADAALLLVDQLAGTSWYVPKRPPAPLAWIECIGAELAEALRQHCAGEERLRIPRDRRTLDALIAADADAVLSAFAERVAAAAAVPPKAAAASKKILRDRLRADLNAANTAECELIKKAWLGEECAAAVMKFLSRGKK